MSNGNLPGLSPLWLISLAMVLGTLIVTLIPISIASGDPIKASDWIGFAGNVLAGVMTLFAAILAWFAVTRQINVAREVAMIRESEAWSVFKEDMADTVVGVDYVWRSVDRASLRTDNFAHAQWRRYQARDSFSYLPKKGRIESLRSDALGLGITRQRLADRVLYDLEALEQIARRWAGKIIRDFDEDSEPPDEMDDILDAEAAENLENDLSAMRLNLTLFFLNLKKLDEELAAPLEQRQKFPIRHIRNAPFAEGMWKASVAKEQELFPSSK